MIRKLLDNVVSLTRNGLAVDATKVAVPCKLVAVISGRLAPEVYGELVHRPGPLQGGKEESSDWYNLFWAKRSVNKHSGYHCMIVYII